MSVPQHQPGEASKPGDSVTRAQERSIAASDTGLSPELLSHLKIRIPGYQLLNVIGQGGQATVYKALQLASAGSAEGKTVAIKLLNSGPYADGPSRQRMRREVLAMKALIGMPNIVGVFDSGQTEDGRDYLVMNFVEGSTLDEFWKHHPAKSALTDGTSDLLSLFKKICEAVGKAHLRGITHRDLSPSNIMVDDQGEPHILDFGLAKTAFDGLFASEANAVSITGQFIGKLAYASPEQARGDSKHIDIRTDVYALGVILYQIVTGGRFPYVVVGNLVDVLNNIIHTQPTPPSKIVDAGQTAIAQNQRRMKSKHPAAVNEVIEVIVLKALEKDPTERYQSAVELARDIECYLAGHPTLASANPWRRQQKTRPDKRNLRVAAMSAMFLIVAGILALIGYSKFGSRHGDQTHKSLLTESTHPAALLQNGRIINLMQMIDLKRDGIRGKWEKRGEDFVCNASPMDGLLRTPYQPPEEYDLRAEFTPSGAVAGQEFIIALLTPLQGLPCATYTGRARGDDRNSARCNIGGDEDPTAVVGGGPLYAVGERSRFLVQVRNDFVSAYVNDRLLVKRKAGFSPGDPASWVWIGKEKSGDKDGTVGLHFAEGRSIQLHRFEVVEVRGVGRILNLSPLGTIPTLPKALPNEKPIQVVDLMPRIDPTTDAVQGNWARNGTELLSESAPNSRIRINYDVPEEYNFHFVFTHRGAPAPVFAIFPHANRNFCLSLGEAYNNICCLRLRGGNGFGYSPGKQATTAILPGILTDGQKYDAVVYVRKHNVAVSVDGKLIIDYPTDFADIGVPDQWSLPLGSMGLGADYGPLTFSKVEIEEITGRGNAVPLKVISRRDDGPATRNSPQEIGLRTVDLMPLIDLKRDAVRGNWEKRPDGLQRLPVWIDGLLRTPYQPPEEYDLRVEFTMSGSVEGVQFDLILAAKGSPCFIYTKQNAGQGSCTVGGWADPHPITTHGNILYEEGKRNVIVVQVRADAVTAYLNDKLLASSLTKEVSGSPLTWCRIGPDNTIGLRYERGNSILIRRIDVVEIKGAGRIVELTPLGTMPIVDKAPPNETPIRLVDLMPFIDPEKDGWRGHWKRDGNELKTTCVPLARIPIRYQPPDEYNLHLVFTRTSGQEYPVGPILSHEGRSFFFPMGDEFNNRCTFKAEKGDFGTCSDPRATTTWSPCILMKDRKYSVIVYVRKTGLFVSVDGKPIIDFHTDFSNVVVPKRWDIPAATLGLVADASEVTFHSVEIEEITGQGHPTTDATTPAPGDSKSQTKPAVKSVDGK